MCQTEGHGHYGLLKKANFELRITLKRSWRPWPSLAHGFFFIKWKYNYLPFRKIKNIHVPAKAMVDIGPQNWPKIEKIVVSGHDF